jgi:hypothetical protein
LAGLTWGLTKLYETFAHSLVFVPPTDPVLQFLTTLPMAVACGGLAIAAWERRPRVTLLLAPAVAGLTAAFMHLLPFDHRVGLHAAWAVLVLAAFALARLRASLPRPWRFVPYAVGTGARGEV